MMFRKRAFFLTMTLMLSLGMTVMAQATVTGTTTTRLNVRAAPTTQSPRLAGLEMKTTVIIEARSADGAWLLMHTQDNPLRGWIARKYVVLVEGDIASLPVSAETIQPAPVVVSSDAPGTASGNITAVTAVALRIRVGPGTNHAEAGMFQPGTTVILEARNEAGDWVIARSADGTQRGWVAARYLSRVRYQAIAALPVSTEILNAPGVASTPPAGEQTAAAPGISPANQPQTTSSGHILPGRRTAAIFQQGQRLGNRANTFMKIGDSVTVEEWFLHSFGEGDYNLGPYTYLQGTVDFFNASGSFNRIGLASFSGLNAAAASDPIWSDKATCRADESPVDCEYRVRKPSLAFIYLLGNDMLNYSAAEFDGYMRKIVRNLINKGVIPVMTVPGVASDYFPEITPLFLQVVRNIAAQEQIPLIDLYSALQTLPGQGVYAHEYHLTLRRDGSIDFNGDQNLYGETLRELLSLQLLHDIHVNVMGR